MKINYTFNKVIVYKNTYLHIVRKIVILKSKSKYVRYSYSEHLEILKLLISIYGRTTEKFYVTI